MSTELVVQDDPQLDATGQTAMAMAVSRQAQEVQAAMVIAKKFPRDETLAIARIKRACARKALAEVSQYAYPRGNETVSGPSIRLAEALAQAWGNIDYGQIELEQETGKSVMMAYCWDLETNTRNTKVFSTPHLRVTKQGSRLLTDPRDIYELTANQGARRVRACILGVIPGDIVDMALAECDKTMAGKNEKPLADRIREMELAFMSLGVTKEMLEQRLGHKIDACIEAELAGLRKIALSIRDGHAPREEFFAVGAGSDEKKPEAGASRSEKTASKMGGKKSETLLPPTFLELKDMVMNVTNLDDVAAVRKKVASAQLEEAQGNQLYELLDQAKDQFESNG